MAPIGRILIVDDEEPVREVLGEYFATQGYAVETAGSGTDALAVVERERPDLVLLDVRMPGLDGVETLRRIRTLDGAVVVIMVTANEDVALARETLKIGAFDYVAKPFDFSYLDRAVAAAFLQAGGLAPARPAPPANEAWSSLARAVFHATRRMSGPARTATGARLEDTALAAAREAVGGHPDAACQWLGQLELLVEIAADLGDLPAAERAVVERALEATRRSLPHPR
ncbi:MAG: hypothetical protein A2050_11845 [Candidatus Rokubacteria bacterium GWA2_73_35]|nr:MAG: hypothetical protein A2050_11845 [Candidatus Rokubacteria bacterium GWA2_73_35]